MGKAGGRHKAQDIRGEAAAERSFSLLEIVRDTDNLFIAGWNGMALGQDQLRNLQGPVQNKNVDPLFKKRGRGHDFSCLPLSFSQCVAFFYLLLNAAHPWTWKYLQVSADSCLCPGPCWGRRELAVTAEGQGCGLKTCPGEAGSTAREQGSSAPGHAHCPIRFHLQSTASKIKLLRIS